MRSAGQTPAGPANHEAARRARRSAGPAGHRDDVSSMVRRALAQLRCELTERIITEPAWLCCGAKQPETIATKRAPEPSRLPSAASPARGIESRAWQPILTLAGNRPQGRGLIRPIGHPRQRCCRSPPEHGSNCHIAASHHRRRPVRPARDAERGSAATRQPIRRPDGATRMPGDRPLPARPCGGLFHADFLCKTRFQVDAVLVAADRLCYTPPLSRGTTAARPLCSILPILAVVQWIERAPPKR